MNTWMQARASAAWLAARVDVRSDRGASAVEYGIMVALIAATVLIAVVFLGQETSRTFSCTGDSLSSSANKC
jgi:pilus assembly protein Flp/PilA